MDRNRREFVRAGGVLGLMVAAGLLTVEQAQAQQAAWNKAAFDTKSVDDTVKALGGTSAAQAVISRSRRRTSPKMESTNYLDHSL